MDEKLEVWGLVLKCCLKGRWKYVAFGLNKTFYIFSIYINKACPSIHRRAFANGMLSFTSTPSHNNRNNAQLMTI